MSAFLGPIHHWLYNKINIQHNIVENIIAYAEEVQLKLDLKNKLIGKYGDAEIKPLEEVIDNSNIHGWLQSKVTLEENRLAYAVTSLLNENSSALKDIETIFYEMGKNVSELNEYSTLEEIYKAINDTLLDGMPCDRANMLLSQEEDEIVWQRNLCVHKDYWDEVNGDISIYYSLRDKFIEGLLESAKVIYEKTDEFTSKISRR